MKTIFTVCLGVLVAICAGCSDSKARNEAAAGSGVAASTYKEGQGLKLTPAAAKFVGIETADFAGKLPSSALLRTVKGDFVYVENGGWFLRTPVALGPRDPQGAADVKEGLYEGDRIVTAGVQGLWLAELQAINGGVGCADGH